MREQASKGRQSYEAPTSSKGPLPTHCKHFRACSSPSLHDKRLPSSASSRPMRQCESLLDERECGAETHDHRGPVGEPPSRSTFPACLLVGQATRITVALTSSNPDVTKGQQATLSLYTRLRRRMHLPRALSSSCGAQQLPTSFPAPIETSDSSRLCLLQFLETAVSQPTVFRGPDG